MTRRGSAALGRVQSIARHMMSTNSPKPEEPSVLFESLLAARTYKLNRPGKLNALDHTMIGLLRSKVEEWSKSDVCGAIWGSGEGRAFCAGGDVDGVVRDAADPKTRSNAIQFFKSEFELDYILAALAKPYIAVMDGITMGGGVGLSIPAAFRVATEKTVFAMPETKIGYCPDVGASFFLSRLDGEMGTYLALTGDTLKGRAVFEHGFATHFIPSRRVPMVLESVSALDNVASIEKSSQEEYYRRVNQIIEENASEVEQPGSLVSDFVGAKRAAVDYAFRHDEVEKIYEDLRTLTEHGDPEIRQWASTTLENLNLRSPTSLKVALRAIRSGRTKTLLQALNMELQIAIACCSGATPDFKTGVEAVLVKKTKERPEWSPSTLEEVKNEKVDQFFSGEFNKDQIQLEIPEPFASNPIYKPSRFALPTEIDIRDMVVGSHATSSGSGITSNELVSKFSDLYSGKLGVREKVLEVITRKCQTVDNADGNRVWLKWVHSTKAPQ
ncbi:3-hydroxyisobutyryl-CoA hydrolase [Marasmius tenuissimus]|uniref:3-hydroxyisobutyryl-CoA hydrolase n=1 Tax=Marasmius tenuissimus TaxID=585030 RepID=A0ABR2ZGW3_9AGAR